MLWKGGILSNKEVADKSLTNPTIVSEVGRISLATDCLYCDLGLEFGTTVCSSISMIDVW